MNLDSRVVAAIKESVKELGQTEALAEKIIAWLDSLASGNDRLPSRDTTERHLELLYQSVIIPSDEE
jgi:hypothetical protein